MTALLERYLNNTCSVEEARLVLEWLETPEGQRHLEEMLATEAAQFEKGRIDSQEVAVPSAKMWASINEKIDPEESLGRGAGSGMGLILRAAAVLLVALAGALLFFVSGESEPTEIAMIPEPATLQFSTDGEQANVTLADGSTIQLNANSEIWASVDSARGERKIVLRGEAYFDVAPDAERPFTISTGRASIRVLGTAFNVKSSDTDSVVQVGVVEGMVSFGDSNSGEADHSVVLSKGQFGTLAGKQITVDTLDVRNYLVWMTGRLLFENMTLSDVCVQLSRIYGLQCTFTDDALADLRLTANFTADSPDKVLAIISLSLGVKYEELDRQVVWSNVGIDDM